MVVFFREKKSSKLPLENDHPSRDHFSNSWQLISMGVTNGSEKDCFCRLLGSRLLFLYTYSAFVSFWIWRNLCALRVIIPLSFAFQKRASQPVMTGIGLVHLYLVVFSGWFVKTSTPISENLLKITPVHRKIEVHSYIYSVWFQLMKKRIPGLKEWKWYYSTRVPETFPAFKRPEKNCSLEVAISFPFDLGWFRFGLFPRGLLTAIAVGIFKG